MGSRSPRIERDLVRTYIETVLLDARYIVQFFKDFDPVIPQNKISTWAEALALLGASSDDECDISDGVVTFKSQGKVQPYMIEVECLAELLPSKSVLGDEPCFNLSGLYQVSMGQTALFPGWGDHIVFRSQLD